MKLKDWCSKNYRLFSERDFRFLIKSVCPDNAIFYFQDIVLTEKRVGRLEEVKNLYLSGIPLPYILGKEEFYGCEFIVDERVLIPRKETELIVEKAVEIIKQSGGGYVLDLGCGCGNIGISIKKNIPEAEVVCSDTSVGALEVSVMNRSLHKVAVNFTASGFFEGFKKRSFDLIVSNPPYVETGSIKGSLKYEPRIALDGGLYGYRCIERILDDAGQYLKGQGLVIMEIGFDQRSHVEKFALEFNYDILEWIKDYAGHWRGVILKIKN